MSTSGGSSSPSKRSHGKKEKSASDKTLVRVIMAGNQSTGKTSLLQKYTKGRFDNEINATVGVDYQNVEIEPNIRVDLWDTAGQERFRSIVSQYFRKAHAVVLVYAIDDRKSFGDLQKWIDQIKENNLNDIMLVGNKIDFEDSRVVTTGEGEKLAKENDIYFIESSAKTGENVKEAFEKVSRRAAEQRRAHADIHSSGRSPTVHLEEHASGKAQKQRCCHSG